MQWYTSIHDQWCTGVTEYDMYCGMVLHNLIYYLVVYKGVHRDVCVVHHVIV